MYLYFSKLDFKPIMRFYTLYKLFLHSLSSHIMSWSRFP